ncbi:MAG: hypothetical protein AABY22_18955 [Nanoarchaeota archaeon]
MSKKVIKATKDFITLFNKIEKIREGVYIRLSKFSGYNEQYCKQNLTQTLKALSKEQVKEVEDTFLLSQVMAQKLWADFYCLEFEEVKDYLGIPKLINYNPKKRVIELQDPNELLFKVRKVVAKFKEDMEKLTKKPINIKPPLSI